MRLIPAFALFLSLAACTTFLPTPTLNPFPTLPAASSTPEAASPTPRPAPSATAAIPPVIHPDNVSGLRAWVRIQNMFTRSLAFSPDSSLLAAASGNKGDDNYLVTIWRLGDGSPAANLAGFTGTVWDTAFSPNGRRIASAADSIFHERGRQHDSQTGIGQAILSGAGEGFCVAYSPDGRQLAIGGEQGHPNGRIWIYDAVTLEFIRELSAAGQNVQDLAYTADSSELIGAGTDGSIRIWSATDGRLVKSFRGERQANRIALSPDGSLLASTYCEASGAYGCETGGVAIWLLPDGKQSAGFADPTEAVAFSADGRLLITGNGSSARQLRIRDTGTGSLIWNAEAGASVLAVSPDGRWLASADRSSITIWSVP